MPLREEPCQGQCGFDDGCAACREEQRKASLEQRRRTLAERDPEPGERPDSR
jgi:hypothetical protein